MYVKWTMGNATQVRCLLCLCCRWYFVWCTVYRVIYNVYIYTFLYIIHKIVITVLKGAPDCSVWNITSDVIEVERICSRTTIYSASVNGRTFVFSYQCKFVPILPSPLCLCPPSNHLSKNTRIGECQARKISATYVLLSNFLMEFEPVIPNKQNSNSVKINVSWSGFDLLFVS